MEIIAQIDSDNFICKINVTEFALLNGFDSVYAMQKDTGKAIKVGSTCDLKKMVNTSKFVRTLRKQSLENVKKQLETSIGNIDKAIDDISSLEVFPILADKDIFE